MGIIRGTFMVSFNKYYTSYGPLILGVGGEQSMLGGSQHLTSRQTHLPPPPRLGDEEVHLGLLQLGAQCHWHRCCKSLPECHRLGGFLPTRRPLVYSGLAFLEDCKFSEILPVTWRCLLGPDSLRCSGHQTLGSLFISRDHAHRVPGAWTFS